MLFLALVLIAIIFVFPTLLWALCRTVDFVFQLIESFLRYASRRSGKINENGGFLEKTVGEQQLEIQPQFSAHEIAMMNVAALSSELHSNIIPERVEKSCMCGTCLKDEKLEQFTICIYDQVFTLLCRREEYGQIIGNLVADFTQSGINVSYNRCSASIMTDSSSTANLPEIVQSIKNRIKVITDQQTCRNLS